MQFDPLSFNGADAYFNLGKTFLFKMGTIRCNAELPTLYRKVCFPRQNEFPEANFSILVMIAKLFLWKKVAKIVERMQNCWGKIQNVEQIRQG